MCRLPVSKKIERVVAPWDYSWGALFCAQMGQVLEKYPLAIHSKLISGMGKTKPPATRTGGSAYQQKGKDETSNHASECLSEILAQHSPAADYFSRSHS